MNPSILLYNFIKTRFMKNSIFKFIAFALIVAITSCSTSSDRQSLYERIAKDEAYETLRVSLSESALLMASDQIDLDAIREYLNENPGGTICDTDDGKLAHIKGGEDYKRLNCKMRQSRNTLKEKYPEYGSFTKADVRELRSAYNEKVSSASEATPLTIIENHIHND
jgi:hypothetical protein